MLDKFLEVAYRSNVEKTAERQLIDRLKTFPIEELKKLASGDETCKLAYALDACGPGSDSSWLGRYTGTPLFSKAVELEKALLQIDMEEQQTRAAQPPMSDAWQKRDAIRLQQRMLDLDLAMAENGGAPAEEGAELAAAGAPAAPKAPKEEGVSPEEAALLAQEASTADAPELALEEAAAAGGEAPPQQEAPPKPKPKAPPKEEETEEEGGPKIEVKQSAAKVAAAISLGRFLAKTAAMSVPDAEKAKVREAVAKKFPGLEKGAAGNAAAIIDGLTQGGHELAGLSGALAGGAKAHEATGGSGLSTVVGGLRGSLGASLGAGLGRNLGERVGDIAASAVRPMGLNPGLLNAVQPAAAALGTLGGGVLGYKALTGVFNKKEKEPKSKHGGEKTAGILGSALSAGKAALPAVGSALSAGKSLATSAYKSGGLGQVASSFGNVAKNFAQKNPLAAAGVVGAGGMVAGKMLSNSQPRQ